MSLLTIDIRLIDRQQTRHSVLEVYAGPDGHRVRFFASPFEAYSQRWSGTEWKEVYHLITPPGGTPPEESITKLFKPTEDILGWREPNE